MRKCGLARGPGRVGIPFVRSGCARWGGWTGGRANNLGLGGAALTFATAAHKNSCLLPDVNISVLLSLVLCLFTLALPLRAQITPGAPVTPPAQEPEPQVSAPPPAPQRNMPTILRIEFQGNRRIRTETLQARIFNRAGDPYNEDALRRDFQALWNTQYFEDVRLEVQDAPNNANAKIVIFYVVERPR